MSIHEPEYDIETIHDLYRRGDYRSAAPRYEVLAAQGSIEAQLILGGMYQHGLGVEKDLNVARAWYSRADALGSIVGTYYLGVVFRQQRQYRDAIQCFERAGAHGYMPALYRLGKMYALGQSVRADRKKAYEYIEQAAHGGHLFAQRDMAWRLVIGKCGLRRIPEGIRKYFAAARAAAKLLDEHPDDDKIR